MLGSSKVPYDIDKLKTCIPAYEPARIDDNLYTLSVIIFYSDHEVSGQRFENVGAWAARKRANTMDPLAIAVRDAKAKKDEINKTYVRNVLKALTAGSGRRASGSSPSTDTPRLSLGCTPGRRRRSSSPPTRRSPRASPKCKSLARIALTAVRVRCGATWRSRA